MTKLEEIERLTLENLHLKAAAAQKELELYGVALRGKYGGPAVREIRLDGSVVLFEAEKTA